MNLHLYLQANRLFFSCLLAFALATPAVAQWDSFKLPCRPAVVDLLTWQGKVYATTQDGNVFVSADDGANWQLVIQGNGLIIHPANGALITYQNRTDGVYLETDQVGAPSSTLVPFAFTYYYTRLNISDNQVYVSNGNNLQRFESGDWQAIPTPPEFYFHECQVRGSHIWADNYAYVLHSPDLGLSWDTVAYDPHFNIGLAAAGDTLLINYFDSVQQVQVLRRSIDQGQSWTVASNVPDVVYIKSGRPFYAQDANQEHPSYSWNGLSDWQKIDADFTPSSIVFSGGAQIVGQAGGVEIKKNGQQSWGDFGIGIPTYSSVYLRQADDLLLFGGDSGPGLFKKKAEDSAWSQNSELYFASQTVQIGNQLVGCGQLGTYRAQLGGPDFKWQLLHPQTGYLFGMNGQLYLVDWQDGKIYRSTDAGSTWTQTGAAPGTDTNSLAAFDGKFFYRNGKNVLISENEGQSWTIRYTFSSGFDESYPASRMYALNGKIFLSYVTTKQVFASNDNGFTFTALTIPQSSTVGIFRLRVYGGQLFLYLGDGVLYRSSDNGQNWKTVKPPYPGFNFDPSVANHAMLVNATQMYLYDPAKGLGWVADLAELEPSPCDDIFIDMEPTGCYPNLSVIAPAGMLYEWFKDGILIQQSIYYYPQFEPKNGSIYKLVITNPMEGCTVSDEIIIIAPVADVAYTPMLPCNQEFDTLDLSGSSHTPGTVYSIFDYSGLGYQYFNQFDAGGNPSNPNPPVVRPGVYILQVSTPDGCYALDTAYIHAEIEIAITGLPTTFSACGQQSGSAGVQYSGDPALTTIGWSNGASGASISGLAPGWYSVTVSEGYCSAQRNFEILEDPACQVKIRGKIQYDPQNADCVADPLAFDFGGMLIHLLPDDIFTTTDANGYYEFIRPPGNYTVKFVDNLHFDVYCPANNSHTVSLPNFGSVAENNDFFINKKFAPNLGISVTPGLALRGSTLQSKITICNFSSEYAADASLVFKHDPLLTNPGPAGFFQSYDPQSYTAVSNIDYVLTYPTCKTYNFDMQVPANAPLGELLHFSMDILPLAGDIFPGDNHVEWTQTVVGSYDPNDKQVSPGENEWGGSIYEKDSVLRYTIRFQNTGSHPATTVEIRDTLDEDLDVGSIITGATSHPFKMLFEGKNGLIFRFENINLPDSLFSQAASQGFVTFTIQRKPNLPIGTVIPNRAGIYFDFNAPVPTNWVESVLRPPAGTGPEPLRQFNIALFPNPNTGCFKIELPAAAPPGMSLRIIDLAGRLVVEKQTEIGSAYQVVNAESLLPGLYFLEVLSKGRILAMKKFVKQ